VALVLTANYVELPAPLFLLPQFKSALDPRRAGAAWDYLGVRGRLEQTLVGCFQGDRHWGGNATLVHPGVVAQIDHWLWRFQQGRVPPWLVSASELYLVRGRDAQLEV
jgi:hypothetical protein